MTPESLYISGTSLRGLSKRFGMSPGYWRKHLMREGVLLRPPGGFSDKSAEVRELAQAGVRQCDIARKLGVSRQRVWAILKETKNG